MMNDHQYHYIMSRGSDVGLNFKAWCFAYKQVLLCESMSADWITGKLTVELLNTNAKKLNYYCDHVTPNAFLLQDHEQVAFWGFVQFHLDMTLKSRYFHVIRGGPNTGGGLGLAANNNCSQSLIAKHCPGYLTRLSVRQTTYLKDVLHYDSLYECDKDKRCKVVHVLFGPASLLNNDNNSHFHFMDHDYNTDEKIRWPVDFSERDTEEGGNEEVYLECQMFKGVYLYTTQDFYLFKNEQILVNYRDSRYVDLSLDSDDDNNDSVLEAAVDDQIVAPTQIIDNTMANQNTSSDNNSSSLPNSMVEETQFEDVLVAVDEEETCLPEEYEDEVPIATNYSSRLVTNKRRYTSDLYRPSSSSSSSATIVRGKTAPTMPIKKRTKAESDSSDSSTVEADHTSDSDYL